MNSLEYAIQMETDGVRYYSEQAQKNEGTVLQKIFDFLAKQELQHEKILNSVLHEAFSDLADDEELSQATGIFTDLESFHDEIRETAPQIEVYQLAREMEQKSIDMYHKLIQEEVNDKNKTIFLFLLNQEKRHYKTFDDIVTFLGRPDEWVEAAEFGTREEY